MENNNDDDDDGLHVILTIHGLGFNNIELVSGAISMGLGGYLAAKSDADHFVTERQREGRSIILFAAFPLI